MPVQLKKYALIVAGGSGKRMGTEVPKQFLEINNYPVILHTLDNFLRAIPDLELFIVIPEGYFSFWNEMIADYGFEHNHSLIKGGTERFYSVKNGLDQIKGDGIIAIHDAVRPLVKKEVIRNTFFAAERNNSAIPVVPVFESLRKKTGANTSSPVNRNDFVLVQTPQTFRLKMIREAYQTPYNASFTDDAAVFEAAGNIIHLTEGNKENIKITTPSDMRIASVYHEVNKYKEQE
jgi:2-C-methyl-D-erythritol 4-phosphate cytidylyltransferase